MATEWTRGEIMRKRDRHKCFVDLPGAKSTKPGCPLLFAFCTKVILLDRYRNDKSKIIQQRNNTEYIEKQSREFTKQISKP